MSDPGLAAVIEQPPGGFSVRFTEMSEITARAIDVIVKNALVAALLHPEAEPRFPSLDEEDSLTL